MSGMILMALVSWWYGAGWSGVAKRLTARIDGTLAFFSVGLLLKTLFDPFRQIGAGRVQGPLAVQFRAWGDRLFSRFVGFTVRTIVIFFGLTLMCFIALLGLLQLLLWPLIPVLPLVGVVVFLIGWTP